jgi:cation transporter-like permease
MPLSIPTLKSLKSSKQSTYDLQARAEGADQTKTAAAADLADVDPATLGQDVAIHGISIASHQQYSYIPNTDTTKSLATDIIQLTRFKNRRPTIPEDRPQRKPSIRNIFLGVPEPNARRFSQDIGGASLVLKFRALESKETTRVLFLQVFIPFLLSGFGNVGAGLFLNYAQTWQVFRDNTIFYMLLATVMAFKTNLEATLAARLSTCSNMGSMRTIGQKFKAFLGNLALVQTQAIIFGLMSSTLVVAINTFEHGEFELALGLRTIATGVAAICVNEMISSCLILMVVVASERAGVNPDNVSTLIAAMFGDFSSVFFISVTAALFHTIQSSEWLFITIICGLICILPLTIYIATRNEFTRGMFLGTHLPLAMAVTVATISGLVFDHAVQSFARIAIYQAVINGISVNLMAVQTSRIATYLAKLNAVAPDRAKEYSSKCSPIEALFAQGELTWICCKKDRAVNNERPTNHHINPPTSRHERFGRPVADCNVLTGYERLSMLYHTGRAQLCGCNLLLDRMLFDFYPTSGNIHSMPDLYGNTNFLETGLGSRQRSNSRPDVDF